MGGSSGRWEALVRVKVGCSRAQFGSSSSQVRLRQVEPYTSPPLTPPTPPTTAHLELHNPLQQQRGTRYRPRPRHNRQIRQQCTVLILKQRVLGGV